MCASMSHLKTHYFRSKGTTLLEIIVVLAIAVFIFQQAIPLGQRWFDTINITQTQSDLARAFTTARSEAQVNAPKVGLDDAVTALCVDDEKMSVQRVNLESQAPCSEQNSVLFTRTLSPKVSILKNADQAPQPLSCICFGASGLSTLDGICNACERPVSLMIKLGETEVDANFS